MKTSDFIKGYACAVASIVKSHGPSTETREALIACGLTSMKALREAGCDRFDIETLRPLIKDIASERTHKRSRTHDVKNV